MSVNGLFPAFNKPQNVFTEGLFVYAGPTVFPAGSIDPAAIRGAVSSGGGTGSAGFVNTLGDQSIGGIKTFSSAPILSGSSITAGTIAATSVSGTAVTLSGTQSITGAKTFSTAPVLSGASITAGTIPAASVSGTAVTLSGSQTITGDKVASGQWTYSLSPNTTFTSTQVASAVYPQGTTCYGYLSGQSRQQTATFCTFFGCFAGQTNTTGYENTYVGALCETSITTGNDNTAVGYSCISTSSNVSQSTSVGASTNVSTTSTALGYSASAPFAKATALGATSSATEANQMMMGTATEYVRFPGTGVNGPFTCATPPTLTGTNITGIPVTGVTGTAVNLTTNQTITSAKTFSELITCLKQLKVCNIVEQLSTTYTWASPLLTLSYANGSAFAFTTLGSSINFTVNLTGAITTANSVLTITILIDTTSFKGYCNVFQLAGTPYTLLYSGGVNNVLITAVTATGLITQTITMIFTASSTVPYRVITSVSACF